MTLRRFIVSMVDVSFLEGPVGLVWNIYLDSPKGLARDYGDLGIPQTRNHQAMIVCSIRCVYEPARTSRQQVQSRICQRVVFDFFVQFKSYQLT